MWANLSWMLLGAVIMLLAVGAISMFRKAVGPEAENTYAAEYDRNRREQEERDRQRNVKDAADIAEAHRQIDTARGVFRAAEQAWAERQSRLMIELLLPREAYRIVPHPSGYYEVQSFSISHPLSPAGIFQANRYISSRGCASELAGLKSILSDLTYMSQALEGSKEVPEVQWAAFGSANPFRTYPEAEAWLQAWCSNQGEIRMSRQGAKALPPPVLNDLEIDPGDHGC